MRLNIFLLVIILFWGCEMRSAADIEKAKASLFQQKTESEISGLPPGFISGLGLNITKEHKITIASGIINVNGKAVKKADSYTITEGDWLCGIINGYWYYLYISDKGQYYIDVHVPDFSHDLYAYYHPIQINYRNIGKLYINETYAGSGEYKPVYVQSNIQSENTTVVVAPSTYQGANADYYCDGVEDNILLNAAISFICNAYGGGTVKLLAGTYNLAATINSQAIYAKPGLILDGEGLSTIIAHPGNYRAIYLNGTSATDGKLLKLSNFYIDGASSTQSSFYINNITTVIIDNLKIENAYNSTTTISGFINCSIKGCEFINNSGVISVTGATNQIAYLDFVNNKLGNIKGRAFAIAALDNGNITGNYFYNVSGGCIDGVFAINNNLTINNNSFYNCNYSKIFAFGNVNNRYCVTLYGDSSLITNNLFNNCDDAILILSGKNYIYANTAINCGNLIDYSACSDFPYLRGSAHTDDSTSLSMSHSLSTAYTYEYSAAYSLRLYNNSPMFLDAYYSFVDVIDSADLHDLAADKEVTLSALVYIPTDSPLDLSEIKLRIGEYYAAAWHYTESTAPTEKGVWQRITVTVTLNAAITGFDADIYIPLGVADDGIVHIDIPRLYVTGVENFNSQFYYDTDGVSQNVSNSWN